MKEHKGKSGWISHGNFSNPFLGTKYGHTHYNRPTLLNQGETDISLDKCVSLCTNNKDCDYVTHGSVRGDPSRECNLRWKEWNKNLAYPTDRPCIPKKGKKQCDQCYMYNVKNVPHTNNKERVHLSNNSQFVTYVKPHINLSKPNLCSRQNN